jgi:hypothetical protein
MRNLSDPLLGGRHSCDMSQCWTRLVDWKGEAQVLLPEPREIDVLALLSSFVSILLIKDDIYEVFSKMCMPKSRLRLCGTQSPAGRSHICKSLD